MQKQTWVIVAGIFMVLVAIGVVTTTIPRTDRPVTIGYLNITASLPFFIAEANGYFEEEGVRYEATPVADSNQLVSGVLARNIDAFPAASTVPVLAAELQSPGRMKVFSVISISEAYPFDALLCKRDAEIASLADVAGKRVGVFPGSTATNMLRKLLDDSGVDVSTVTFIPMPPASQLTALIQGSIDVLHAYEPTIAIAKSRADVRQFHGSVYAALLDENPQAVAVVNSAFLESRPEAAYGVMRALERGVVFMRENEEASRRILQERMRLEPAVADATVLMRMLPRDEIDTAIFQQWADMLAELGELQDRVPVDNLLHHE